MILEQTCMVNRMMKVCNPLVFHTCTFLARLYNFNKIWANNTKRSSYRLKQKEYLTLSFGNHDNRLAFPSEILSICIFFTLQILHYFKLWYWLSHLFIILQNDDSNRMRKEAICDLIFFFFRIGICHVFYLNNFCPPFCRVICFVKRI